MVVSPSSQRSTPSLPLHQWQSSNRQYQPCKQSRALAGMPIATLEEMIWRASEGTNASAATWFTQQITQSAMPDARCKD